ncbi:MAG: M23 family peptidase, partial [Bacteroidota bacterium]|nr:M23 family peptidase [Bacteroidota bacterium]
IELQDAAGNTTTLNFSVQYDAALAKEQTVFNGERFLPNNMNVFEREDFQVVTTEKSIYDTVAVVYSAANNNLPGALSLLHNFLSAAIPSHDSVTVRIKPSVTVPEEWRERIVIKNISGSKTFVEKAIWQKGWVMAKFRQFGSYQALIDNLPPAINTVATDLSKASRIIFTPTDNFKSIKSFRAELDGHWLRFTNDKGRSWIYTFDEKFPKGEHELKVRVEDEAGNVTGKIWKVRR